MYCQKKKIIGSAAFLEVSHCESPSFLRQTTVQRSLLVTCAAQPTREAIVPTALCGQGSFSPAQGIHFLPSSPLNKRGCSSLRMLCRTAALPLLWVTAIYHHEDALSNINTTRLIMRCCSLPVGCSLEWEPC